MLRRWIRQWREEDKRLIREVERHFGKPAAETGTAWRSVVFWSVVIVLALLLYRLASQR